MAEKREDESPQEKPGSWGGYPVKTRDRWLFSILSVASFLTLQTSLALSPKEIENDFFLTLSLWIFAVALPMDVLLVLLTYAKQKRLHDRVRLCVEWTAAVSTVIGIDLALFFHASFVRGIVFTGCALIAGLLALYYVHTPGSKAGDQE